MRTDFSTESISHPRAVKNEPPVRTAILYRTLDAIQALQACSSTKSAIILWFEASWGSLPLELARPSKAFHSAHPRALAHIPSS